MSTPAEEPLSQNGLQPDPTTNPESQPESQPVLEPEPAPVPETQPEPVPEPEAQPEPEAKPELQPRTEPAVIDGADPTVEESKETSTPIQSSSQGTARPELKRDEGSRTFTMRELLNGLKNEGNDAANESSSPYSYRFTSHSSPFVNCVVYIIW